MRENRNNSQNNIKNKKQFDTKVQMQKISMIEYRDQTLENYRRSLIQQQSFVTASQEPEIIVKNVRIYDGPKLISQFPISKNIKLKLAQNTLYTVEIQFYVNKGIVYGFTISNMIFKKIIRLSNEQFRQGTYAPSKNLQTASFQIKTPGGLLGRGSYTGESYIKDKYQKIYTEVKYLVQVYQNI